MNEEPITTCNGKLALALSKAQATMQAVKKDASAPIGNQGQRRSYATLSSTIDACRDALATNELAVLQKFLPSDAGTLTLETVLRHSSGESESSILTLQVGQNPGMNPLQALGSAISYARRYSLTALLCLATEDDDDGAGAAQAHGVSTGRKQATPPQTPSLPPTAQGSQMRPLGDDDSDTGHVRARPNGSTADHVEEHQRKSGMDWLKDWMVAVRLPESKEMFWQIVSESLGRTVDNLRKVSATDWAMVKAHCQSLKPEDIKAWQAVGKNTVEAGR